MTYPPKYAYPVHTKASRRIILVLALIILGGMLVIPYCHTPAPAGTKIEQVIPALISAKNYDWMQSYVLAYGLRAKIISSDSVMYYKRYLVGVKSPPGDEEKYIMRVQFSYLPVSPGSGVNISLHYEKNLKPGLDKKVQFFMDDADMDRYPNSIIKTWHTFDKGILKHKDEGIESLSIDNPMWNYWLNYLHERFRNEEARR